MIDQTPIAAQFDNQPLLTRKDLESVLKVCGRTIERLVARGRFPAPIYVGRNCRWELSKIEKYIQNRGMAYKLPKV